MKKFFTFLFLISAISLVQGQDIIYEDILIVADFEGDPEDHGYTLGGWGYEELEIVDNPFPEGINESAKVVMQNREPGNWNSAADIMFDEAVVLGDRNTLRVKFYAETDVYVYMRPLDSEGEPLGEDWAARPAPGGEWSYGALDVSALTEFYGVRMEFSTSWGDTPEDANTVTYFDDIEISKAVVPMFEPDRIYIAVKTTEEMELDGFDIEDAWFDVDPSNIENVNFVMEGETAVPAQGSNFRALFDDDFLYLFIEIMDNSPTAPTTTDWWNHDGVEIFMDGEGRNAAGGRLSGQYQIRINYDTETLSGQDGATVDLFMDNGMHWGQGSMTGGYTIEAAIPWISIYGGDEEAAAAAGDGFFITFDLALADHDPAIADERYCNVIWAGVDGEHHPYESSQYWGAIKSEGFVTVEETTTESSALVVYPMPVTDRLTAQMQNMASYQIISITGALIMEGSTHTDQVDINTSSLNPGIYLFRAIDTSGDVRIQKIIKH